KEHFRLVPRSGTGTQDRGLALTRGPIKLPPDRFAVRCQSGGVLTHENIAPDGEFCETLPSRLGKD
ncbi:MAG: hypothetical protein ACREDY_17335, partial [Bradyrhizobium sp.]